MSGRLQALLLCTSLQVPSCSRRVGMALAQGCQVDGQALLQALHGAAILAHGNVGFTNIVERVCSAVCVCVCACV